MLLSFVPSAAFASVLAPPRQSFARPAVVLRGTTPRGMTAEIRADGLVQLTKPGGGEIETRHLAPWLLRELRPGATAAQQRRVLALLDAPRPQPFARDRVLVVFRAGYAPARDLIVASRRAAPATAAFSYTNDNRLNRSLAALGVDRMERIGRHIPRSQVDAMQARLRAPSAIEFGNAYVVHLTGSSVRHAVKALAKKPQIALVEPDWSVASLDAYPIAVGEARLKAAKNASFRRPFARANAGLPSNYGIASSEQSYLNASGINDLAAYDLIEKRFKQLPGTGEIVTNVSQGDVCVKSPTGEGSSSHQIGGQDYLDVPSMPLIPEYAADLDGNLHGNANVCNTSDIFDDEILLDFSVMAPLPHDLQRSDAIGSGFSDLLGIAPGAKYRLVVPEDTAPTVSDLSAAFLAAANQQPRPNVISASLGYGLDAYGFPSRYLEEDPIMQNTIAAIVASYGIVVCISAGDGLRLYTNAPVAPSGGSEELNVAATAAQATNLNDVSFSTARASVVDSGTIVAGGVTTDDIFSASPWNAARPRLAGKLAFATTRWNGGTYYSSTYGSRVNLSAPSDNIPALELNGTAYNNVNVVLNGGTSASAPMTAAAAAVALQVARLTGHPLNDPAAVRALLTQTASQVANPPQSDRTLHVGPELDLGRAVQTLLSKGGDSIAPRIARMGIAQRQPMFDWSYCGVGGPTGDLSVTSDMNFTEATDPTDIVLDNDDPCGVETGTFLNAPITIAPDWEGLPAGTRYRIFVANRPRTVLATTPWVRLLPQRILSAAGLPVASSTARTVSLTYEALNGLHVAASQTFALTFSPSDGQSQLVPAPAVAPVVTGNTIAVRYDLSKFPAAILDSPVVVVSYPGRIFPSTGEYFAPAWTSPVLTAPKGTVDVPVSVLQGAGVYGIGIQLTTQPYVPNAPQHAKYSDFAVTRVQVGSSIRPPAPLLSIGSASSPSSAPTASLNLPFGSSFTASYDVSMVPGATGAILEISSPGPTGFGNYNPFNNPNGSEPDANGRDTGSLYTQVLGGMTGSVTLGWKQANLVPAMTNVVRVIPMHGSQAVGEASDVASISTAGIMAADGQNLTYGYAIDPAGDDAFYTSNGETFDVAGGTYVPSTSIGTFSQSTGAVKQEAGYVFEPPPAPFSLRGGGYVSGGTIVYNRLPAPGSPEAWFSSKATAANAAGGWTMPLTPTADVLEMGENQVNGTSAYLEVDPGPTGSAKQYGAFTANVVAETSTPVIPITPPPPTGMPVMQNVAFDYDASTNMGYALFEFASFFGNSVQAQVLATIDFTAGTVTYTSLGKYGTTFDLVVDPTTHLGAFGSAYTSGSTPVSQLCILDLATGTVTQTVPIPSEDTGPTIISVDTANHLFAVQNPYPASDATDNNALSDIAIVSESGSLVKETPHLWNLSDEYLLNHWFGVNGTTRQGFIFGPNVGIYDLEFNSIIPFTY